MEVAVKTKSKIFNFFKNNFSLFVYPYLAVFIDDLESFSRRFLSVFFPQSKTAHI